jgi:hypothetical protein
MHCIKLPNQGTRDRLAYQPGLPTLPMSLSPIYPGVNGKKCGLVPLDPFLFGANPLLTTISKQIPEASQKLASNAKQERKLPKPRNMFVITFMTSSNDF